MPSLGKIAGYTVKSGRLAARGASRTGGWVGRRVQTARVRGGAGEVGMMRLLDLHAISCAGDTLVTMGLAGTVFFSVSAGAARGRVALYLLITMAPFALVSPIVGPVLDRFRHGRRYALAATMLGRAFLAWMISDYIHGFGLYPAAFGVLVLSRAYGVARSAAVPRLLPASLGLSQVGARASVFGAVAGAVVAPLGVLAFRAGAQWPLRVAALIFLAGMVVSLRLPPRADSDPPETVPAIFHRGRTVLSGRLVYAVLAGSAMLRGVYGFLALFLAFAVRAGHLPTGLLGMRLSQAGALGVVAGALGVGSFLATAAGTRLHIRRPALLQCGMLLVVAVLGVLAILRFDLLMVALFCLGVAIASGLAKLAVDATIQERIPEQVRASAFAHSETALMLAWVLGGAIGLIPFTGRVGFGVAAVLTVLAALRALVVAVSLRKAKLRGVASGDVPPVPDEPERTTQAIPAGRPTGGGGQRGERTTRRRFGRGQAGPAATRAPSDETTHPITTQVLPAADTDSDKTTEQMPGYHLYRPTGRPPSDDEDYQ